jgi:hypothetical protein
MNPNTVPVRQGPFTQHVHVANESYETRLVQRPVPAMANRIPQKWQALPAMTQTCHTA